MRALVAGVAVDRGDETIFDTAEVADAHDHRGGAVGGTTGVGDYHIRRIEQMIVHAEHNGPDTRILRGRGEHHLLGPGGDVRHRRLTREEVTRALEHHIDVELRPRQSRRVLLRKCQHVLPAQDEVSIVVADLATEDAMHGIILEQVRQGLVVREVIHGHELDVLAIL